MKKKRKARAYTITDLQRIAEQIGGRLRIEIWPAEMTLAEWKALRDRAEASEKDDSWP